jgi:uncharacterized membrane protein YgcG
MKNLIKKISWHFGLPEILAMVLITLIAFTACEPRSKTKSSVKIKKYKQHSVVANNDPNDDWIFWYIIYNNDGSCYYYNSPSPVANYNSVSWTKASDIPSSIRSTNSKAEELEEIGEEEISNEEMSQEFQAEMEAETSENAESNSETGTESSSESSSDAGSSDAGGGDGGGGGE